MEWATIWAIVGIIAAGVTGALLRTWSLSLQILALHRRVKQLEGFQLSDSNREKAQKRWNPSKVVEELRQVGGPSVGVQKAWWEP